MFQYDSDVDCKLHLSTVFKGHVYEDTTNTNIALLDWVPIVLLLKYLCFSEDIMRLFVLIFQKNGEQ